MIALVAAMATGCGSSTSASDDRVGRCAEHMLARVEELGTAPGAKVEVERYVRTTYCVPLERRGVVHDDGTLAIGAYTDFFIGGRTCARSEAGEPSRTVPCEAVDKGVLDCAPLHFVRRTEVQSYLATLESGREVKCDDGTPLDQLGAR